MRAGIVILLVLLISASLAGQCLTRNSLWNRISYLKAAKFPPDKQLSELLPYLNKIGQCPYRNDSTHALLLHRIGALYSLQKDFFSAIQYTRRSINLINEQKQKNNPAVNPADVIKSYWNLNIFYDSLRLGARQMEAIDSCIATAGKLGAEYDYALNALEIKVRELFNRGDYYRCIENEKLGEDIIKENGSTLNYAGYFESQAFPWRINALIFLNKAADAEQLVTDKIREYEKQHDPEMLAALYGLYGAIKRSSGDIGEALFYFQKSFTLNKKINHTIGCAEALNNIGLIYFEKLHQNAKALQYYSRALSFTDNNSIEFANNNEPLNILGNISNVYIQSLNFDSAFYFFQKAFDKIKPGYTEADLLINNDGLGSGITEYITATLLDKADAYLKQYKISHQIKSLDKAINTYTIADLFFDKIKKSQSGIKSKLFSKTNNRRLYEHAIEACFITGNMEQAFYFFEKSRSLLLNDQIMEQRVMSESDLAKRAQLKKNILDITLQLQEPSVSAKEALMLRQQLFNNNQQEEALVKTINSRLPVSTQKYLDTTSLTLEIFRKKVLVSGKSLLELFYGDSAVYILSVTSKNTFLHQLSKHLYDSLTTTYISFVTDREKLNNDFSGYVNIAHSLYEVLFQNIPLKSGESLVISPDGKSFPFEALTANKDVRKPDYLLNHYATSYTYSAKYLVNESAINKKNGNSVLGMAPVKFNDSLGLQELRGSDGSLAQIKSRFSNATNFVLEKATKHNFLQNFYDYAVIQLYTHASDSSRNDEPVIYFADSPLYLSYLIPERTPVTQLVVLSACETANGKLYEGEGIFSFNRGFAALGIPAAISNLWSVDDLSTYRITELFYKYLSMGLPTDVALQKAKLEFINTSPSIQNKMPYFWAGPILTGKVDTIRINPGVPWKMLIPGAILLLAVGYFIKKIILRRRAVGKANLLEKI